MATDVETVVIGAGVVGLAIARACAEAGNEVLLLERHNRVGAETSSRNSEVIHAGIYYPKDSLRACLCIDGRKLLYSFAAEFGVPAKRCGKLIVATDTAEIAALEVIAARAVANGVDVRRLERTEARELEPEVECAAALYSPSTGIIDVHALMLALEGLIGANNGQVVLNSEVQDLTLTPSGDFAVTTEGRDGSTTITAHNLVIAAGLEAQRLGGMLHAKRATSYLPPPLYLAKAHYYVLSGRVPFRHLIYPIPAEGGLGIHLTLDMAGQARFGPDIEWVNKIDYTFDDADGRRRATFEDAFVVTPKK